MTEEELNIFKQCYHMLMNACPSRYGMIDSPKDEYDKTCKETCENCWFKAMAEEFEIK